MKESIKKLITRLFTEYMCHVYVRGDSLAGVLISDHEYPNRVSHTLITKVLDEFAVKYSPASWPSLNEATTDFNQMNVYLAKYQNPREADALTKMQNDLDETKIILVKQQHSKKNYYLQNLIFVRCFLQFCFVFQHSTLEAVLQRGEKLDDLVAKSEGLSIQSKAFYKTARKTNSCCSLTG